MSNKTHYILYLYFTPFQLNADFPTIILRRLSGVYHASWTRIKEPSYNRCVLPSPALFLCTTKCDFGWKWPINRHFNLRCGSLNTLLSVRDSQLFTNFIAEQRNSDLISKLDDLAVFMRIKQPKRFNWQTRGEAFHSVVSSSCHLPLPQPRKKI